jgi:DNA-binding transcriptional regulator YiaG
MDTMQFDYSPSDIKTLRDRRRMTQADLAEFVGVAVNQVKRWEAGQVRSIQVRFLRKLDELAAKPALPAIYTPELLKELRRKLRFTQADLAAAIGYEISSIKFWESGHRSAPGTSKESSGALKALDKLAAKVGMFE